MKNNIYTFVYIFIISQIILSCNETNSDKQTGEKADKVATNTDKIETSTYTDNKYTLPSELFYTKKRDGFVYDKFYPIGWSDDGKFAYIAEPSGESSGLYFFEIHIVDIINNKQLWYWQPEESEEGNIQNVWKENNELFTQHLNEYKIIQFSDFKLQPTSITYKGNDFELLMDSKMETDADYGVDVVKGIKLSMKSPQLGTKVFFEQRIDLRDYILSAFISGILISPYNDRIVVICQKERMGATGPPNVVYFEIIGSNLSTGFTKETLN